MSQSLLRAHEVLPLFFNLGGRLSPISIRDQMVRAQMLVDGALERGVISLEPFRPLLVVGAGAAGATAAMWASKNESPVLLIDRELSAFSRQAGCRTRRIDPSQYDWPAPHWENARFPSERVLTPMPWNADDAHHLAALWQIRLQSMPTPFFGIAYRTTVLGILPLAGGSPVGPMGWRATLSGFPRPIDFGMVLWTVGFGNERCDLGDYTGFPFWASDPFQMVDCGVAPANPQIVISGSGDGALQDFLRVATGIASPKEIYIRCGFSATQRERVERTVQAAEDVTQRELHWGPKRGQGCSTSNDHLPLQVLHGHYEGLVESILGPAGRTNSNRKVKKALDGLVRTPLPQLHLVHGCDHFSSCYPLNHFLVVLIGHYLKTERRRSDVFLPNRRVAAVTVQGGHTCSKNWLTCHGELHRIDLIQAVDCRNESSAPTAAGELTANVVIIRHGVDSSALPPLPEVTLPRQRIPYYPVS